MNEQRSPLAYSCGGDKFVHLLGLSRCAHCDAAYKPKTKTAMYCTKACKVMAFRAKNPDRVAKYRAAEALKAKVLRAEYSRYYTGHCNQCHSALGSRSACTGFCSSECKKANANAHSLARAMRLHAQDARVIECDECMAQFCPLYGASHAELCVPCAQGRARAAHSYSRAIRKARKRAATVERVDPHRVFDRDGWRCQLCGIKTPKAKRGTYADNAPELDHILPLAKGGEHSYRNTQCACRKCNGAKSDTPMGQMLLVG